MKNSVRIKQYKCKEEGFEGRKKTKRGNCRPILDEKWFSNRAFVLFFNNTNIPTILKIVLTNEELGKTGMPTLVWH